MRLLQNEIRRLAIKFRNAIEIVKSSDNFYKGQTGRVDKMTYFPRGCCDDATDLFGYYLLDYFGIDSKQENGVLFSDNLNEKTNHVWLIFEDTDFIVDLTYDQFKEYHCEKEKIFVGPKSDFYLQTKDNKIYSNYNFSKDGRLMHDYLEIVEILSSSD